jgi:hypothetical protein
MFPLASLALLAVAPPGASTDASSPSADASSMRVIPFRTELRPRVDPVFGDALALRASVDRFFALEADMDRVRDEFSTAVHETLAALAGGGALAKGCPAAAGPLYARALAAGGKYLLLGQQLQARVREIRRADDLGDAAALTPDYRAKIKKVRERFQLQLNDYREMRVAFYDQLAAEMRHASCKPGAPSGEPTGARAPGAGAAAAVEGKGEAEAPNPLEASAWNLALDEGSPPLEAPVPATRGAPRASPHARAVGVEAASPGGTAPAIWIDVDNTLCAQPTRVFVDGQPLGEVGPRKRTSVRTHAGPRELCALPASDPRACGAPGTVRKAYLHEGWSLTVHCGP